MFLAIINDTYSDVKGEITADVLPVAQYALHTLKWCCYKMSRACGTTTRTEPKFAAKGSPNNHNYNHEYEQNGQKIEKLT